MNDIFKCQFNIYDEVYDYESQKIINVAKGNIKGLEICKIFKETDGMREDKCLKGPFKST